MNPIQPNRSSMEVVISELLNIQNPNPTNIVENICAHDGIRAATLYTTCPDTDNIYRMANFGFPCKLYSKPWLDRHKSMAGEVLLDDLGFRIFSDVNSYPGEDHNVDYAHLDVDTLVAVQILNYPEHNETARGVLCIYPDPEFELSCGSCKTLANIVARLLYEHDLAERARIWGQLWERAYGSRDFGTAAQRVIAILSELDFVDAATIYVYDDTRKRLQRIRTTGFRHGNDDVDGFSLNSDAELDVVRAFTESTDYLHVESFNGSSNQPLEFTTHTPTSSIHLPFYSPPTSFLTSPRKIGVLSVVNRLYHMSDAAENKSDPGDFSFSDISFFKHVAQNVGAIITLHDKVRNLRRDFARAGHGVRSNLHSLKLRTEQFHLAHPEPLGSRWKYHLEDTIYQLEALEWQVEIFTDSQQNRIVKEFTDVVPIIRKTVSGAQSLARYYSIELKDRKKIYDGDRFRSIPEVQGNHRALSLIFRNLIENGVKYSKRREACKLKINWRDGLDSIFIVFEDWGIGIEESDKKAIFEDGYRGEKAKRRQPIGIGSGLFDSQNLAGQLGGEISVENFCDPTRVVVRIPKWKNGVNS